MDRQKRRQILIQLIAEQHCRCIYCSELIGPLATTDITLPTTPTIDHVQPRSRGGRDVRENMVMACHECNTNKSNIHQPRCGPTPDQILHEHSNAADQRLIRHWVHRLDRSLAQICAINPNIRKKAIWNQFQIWETELLQNLLKTQAVRRPIHDAGMYLRDLALVACWQLKAVTEAGCHIYPQRTG